MDIPLLMSTVLQGPSSGGGIQMDVMRRQEQLDLKEKELIAREAELKKQQEQMIRDGTLKPKKNWPRCYPITHHDIAGDVSSSWSKSKDWAFESKIEGHFWAEESLHEAGSCLLIIHPICASPYLGTELKKR